MEAIKQIDGVGTPQGLQKVMTENGVPVPNKVQEVIAAINGRNGFRAVLAVLITLLIAAGTYFSFKGAVSVFGSQAPAYASIFFAILDLVITWVVYKEMLTGSKKWGILIFEAATFVWFAITLAGYFGIGSLQSAANQKVTAMYAEVSGTSYNDANSLFQSMQQAKDKAASIKKIEEERDGKGVVWEKAKMISEAELREPETLPLPPKAPTFENLPEANEWLQGEKAKLDEYNQKLTSYVGGLKNSAASSKTGVQGSISEQLSGPQRANLDVLVQNLDGVANYALTASNIPAPMLTPADMKSTGFGAVIGWVVEGVVFLLLIVLAGLSSGTNDMELLKKECILALVENFLNAKQVQYIRETLHDLPQQAMVRVVDLLDTDTKFINYVKKNGTFNQFVTFAKEHPVLVSQLPDAKWKFTDIEKTMEADPESRDYLDEVISIDKAKWDRVSALIKNRTKAIQLGKNPELLQKFLDIVESFERKFANKPVGDIERTLNQLLPEDATPQYLEVLYLLTEKLSAKMLQALNRSFVLSLTKNTASLLVKNVTIGNEEGFPKIVQAWGTEENELCSEMLDNNIATDPQFGRLVALTLNSVGVDGLRTMHSAYSAAHKNAAEKAVSSKVFITSDALTTLSTAIGTGDHGKITGAITGSFEVKPTVSN